VLERAAIGYRLHQHPPVRTEADLHLTGLDVDTSAKTLAFSLPDGRFVLAAIPGRSRLRYGNLARALGVPRSALRPMPEAQLGELGMEPGGVSPITDHVGATLVLDRSLLSHDRLYCGSGLADSSIEVAAADLARLSPATTVLADLCGDAG
jgi:Cys-tRNA(Pro)/Cys-tRNA(Cys) deacylase